MKNSIIKFAVISLSLGFITSCSDDFKHDFLEQTNPNEISTDIFWRNLSETQTGLHSVYKTWYDPDILNINEEMLRSDMGFPSLTRPLQASPSTFYIHTYTETTDNINEKWQDNYLGIFRANQVIEALNRIEGTVTESNKENWTSQMAQARFFRGLFHYYLYTTFNKGNIIIRDFIPSNPEEYEWPLSSAEDVIAFIKKDLEYAYTNLYKKGAYPDGDGSKVTSGAAGAILGNIYLNEFDYTKAATYYQDVIDNHGYELLKGDAVKKMFTLEGEFNSESILEINFTKDNIDLNFNVWSGQTGTNNLNFLTRGNNDMTAQSPAWIAHAYKFEEKDPLDARNYHTYTNRNGEEKTRLRAVPLRCSQMMAIIDDIETIYYQDSTHFASAPVFQGAKWGGLAWWKKYTNHDILKNESDLEFGAQYSTKNVTVIRLAEVILNLAECKIKTGDVAGGLELINQIRDRWGLILLGVAPNGDPSNIFNGSTYDGIVYDQTSLMSHLMRTEKPLELGAEGHAIRWIDFQRWKVSENYGFKDRLEELSNAEYFAGDFTYVNENGQNITKTNAASMAKTQADASGIVANFNYEYDLPFQNYNEELHGYYPIPSTEKNNNNNID